jgi:hypothetical protein
MLGRAQKDLNPCIIASILFFNGNELLEKNIESYDDLLKNKQNC